jgi:hypothetical protein
MYLSLPANKFAKAKRGVSGTNKFNFLFHYGFFFQGIVIWFFSTKLQLKKYKLCFFNFVNHAPLPYLKKTKR